MCDHTYPSTSVVLTLSLSPSCPLKSCWFQNFSCSMTAHITYRSPIWAYINAIEVRIIYPSILIHIASVNSLTLAFVTSAYAATPNPATLRVFNSKKHGTTTTSSILQHNMYAMRKADMLQSKFRSPLSNLLPCCIQGKHWIWGYYRVTRSRCNLKIV